MFTNGNVSLTMFWLSTPTETWIDVSLHLHHLAVIYFTNLEYKFYIFLCLSNAAKCMTEIRMIYGAEQQAPALISTLASLLDGFCQGKWRPVNCVPPSDNLDRPQHRHKSASTTISSAERMDWYIVPKYCLFELNCLSCPAFCGQDLF